MPVFTPNGLKIRYSPDFIFALLNRLYPRLRPHIVLYHAQNILNIPTLLSDLGAVYVLSSSLVKTNFWWLYLVAIMLLGRTLGVAIVAFSHCSDGWIFWGLSKIAMLHIYINTSLRLMLSATFLSLCLLGYYRQRFMGTFVIIAGICASYALEMFFEQLYARHEFRTVGEPHTFAEACFDISYIQFAKLCNANQSLDVSASERDSANWNICQEDYERHIGRSALI